MRLYTSNSLQQLRAKSKGQLTPGIPSKIYIDLTRDCNLHCVMCRETPGRTGRTMEIDLFKRIVDETCHGVTSYSLFDWGEPLLVKDFRERLVYLFNHKRTEALIDISTNGMLMDEETSKFLIEHDVEVTVSFDGANKRTFERIRRGANYELICRHLKMISGIAAKMASYRAPGIYIAIQEDNWNELLEIVERIHSLGVRRIGMGPVVAPQEYSVKPTRHVLDNITRAINYAEENGMAVDVFPTRMGEYVWDGNTYIDASRFYIDENCDAPLTCTSIGWDGDVFLCCNEGEFVENLKDRSFVDIWMGDRYQELRERVNTKEAMPQKCKTCSWVNRY